MRSYWASGAAALLTVILLAGCSRSSFLGRQFDDLTARYNTHYNANRTFREQERRLEQQDQPVDFDRYLLSFEIPSVSGRSAEFEKVIEKSADLLRKHPQSKWADDALMLIGKSYFYQSNYVGAEQKFNEIIALSSSRHDEAIFWLARTLVASQSQEAAEDVIRTALADEQLDKKFRPRLYLLLGDLRTDFEDWEGAIAALQAGLPEMDDGDLAARAEFLLGQLYETVEDYPAAIEAYRQVRKHKPLYELSFASMYSQYRVEGLHGDPDVALEGIEKMLRDNKHYQYLDRLEYLKGRVYAAGGDPIASRKTYYDILNPPPGRPQTAIRGEVHYRMGELYRDLIGDFQQAAAHFDTAASALRTTTVQNETYTPDAIVDARATADVFSTYRDVTGQVHEMDSLLHLGSLNDEDFDAAVRKVREALALQAARVAEELERRQTQSSFQRAATEAGGAAGTQTSTGTAGNRQGQYGFLNHKDIRLVQEAYLNFRRVWGDRPLVPGWRREEVILMTRSDQQDELDKAATPAQQQALPGTQMTFLPPVDISNVPRDSVSQARMRSRRAEARYKLANVLFLQAGLPDSAAYWYRLVIEQDSNEPVAFRAMYAMAEVHLAMGDELAAERLLDEIIRENPESVFADRARATLGMEAAVDLPDSTEVARHRYKAAYDQWRSGNLSDALNMMVRTAADNPRMDVAAKSLLAGAAIYTEMARLDSLDLFGIIPLRDSLFTEDELARARAVAGDTVVASLPDSAAVDTMAVIARSDEPTAEAAEPVETAEPTEPAAELIDTLSATPEVVDADPAVDEPSPVDTSMTQLVEPELKIVRHPTGDSLAKDDELLLRRGARTAQQEAAPVDEDLIVRGDVTAVAPDDREPVEDRQVEDSVTVAAAFADTTVADSLGTPSAPARDTAAMTPAAPRMPEKPAWVDVRYHVNGVVPQPMTLHGIYTAVEQHFSDSEFGERAAALKRGLVAHRDELFAPQPDTTNPGPPDEPVGQVSPVRLDTTLAAAGARDL